MKIMKIGEKAGVFFVFLLIALILFDFIGSVNAEEQKNKFNPKKGETWQYGSATDFNLVSAEDIANNPDYRDDYWEKFSIDNKNKFVELELKKNTGKDIKTNNLGNNNLKLKGSILSDGKVSFDLKNPPNGLKSINYQVVRINGKGDKVDERGYRYMEVSSFLYDYGDKKKIAVEEGFIDKNNKIQGMKNSYLNGLQIPENGRFRIYDSGVVFSGAEIKIGEITYRQYSEGSGGLVNPISETRAEIQNAEAVSSRGIIGSSLKTLAVFDDNPIDETKYKQYVRLGKDNLEIVGNKINVEMLQAYKNVKFFGKSFSLKNGEVIYKIDKEGRFKIPGAQETIANDMFRIENLMDPKGNVFINTHLGEGSLLRDIRGYVRVGTDFLSIGSGKEGESEISKEAGFKAFGGIKAELVVPEGSKIPPEKGDPKTLVMTYNKKLPSTTLSDPLKKGSEEQLDSAKKEALIAGGLGLVGRLAGFETTPIESAKNTFLSSMGYSRTSGIMDTTFTAMGALLDKKDFNNVLSIINSYNTFNTDEQISFTVTSDGKGRVIFPGGKTTDIRKDVVDGIIMGTIKKYPRLVKKQ